MLVRKIDSKDIQTIKSIYNHYIINTLVSFEEQPVSAEEMQTRVEKVTSLGLPWLVAEKNGEVVGYAYAGSWNPRSAYKNSAEITVYLSHQHLGKGWGSRLYQQLFQELERTQVHTVIGGIALPNNASVALHEKFGLTKVAHYKEVGYKFGQWIDVGYWQKLL